LIELLEGDNSVIFTRSKYCRKEISLLNKVLNENYENLEYKVVFAKSHRILKTKLAILSPKKFWEYFWTRLKTKILPL